MTITTDFNVFANNYHKQNGTTNPIIMSQLPNNLIMKIIKVADGGLNTHKSKYSNVMGELLGYNASHYLELECPASEVWGDILKNTICPEGCYNGMSGLEYDYWLDPCPASKIWFERIF